MEEQIDVRESSPDQPPARSERSDLEAGLLGLAVLHGIAGAVLLIVPLLITMSGVPFAASDYELGLVCVFLTAVWWGGSRISRRVERSDRATTSRAPEERWPS